MSWIQRTLATIGLATMLSACGGQTLRPAVLFHDWSQSERYTFDMGEGMYFSSRYDTSGYLARDASQCEQGEGCHDMVIEAATINGDAYARITIDTRLVNEHTGEPAQRLRARIILHNSEGDNSAGANEAWVDDAFGRYDGIYDRHESVPHNINQYIGDVLQRQIR